MRRLQGTAAAFNGLGVMAMNGQGLPQNHSLAALAFEQGAALSDPDAIYNLGMLYTGEAPCSWPYGVCCSVLQSCRHTRRLRVFPGVPDAGAMLKVTAAAVGGYGVPQNETIALELLHEAHDLGHWRAPLQASMLLVWPALVGLQACVSSASTLWPRQGWRTSIVLKCLKACSLLHAVILACFGAVCVCVCVRGISASAETPVLRSWRSCMGRANAPTARWRSPTWTTFWRSGHPGGTTSRQLSVCSMLGVPGPAC